MLPLPELGEAPYGPGVRATNSIAVANIGTERGKLADYILIAPAKMLRVDDPGLAFGHQCGKHQTGTTPDIQRPDIISAQPGRSADDRLLLIDHPNVGTHFHQFLDIAKTVIEHTLEDSAFPPRLS